MNTKLTLQPEHYHESLVRDFRFKNLFNQLHDDEPHIWTNEDHTVRIIWDIDGHWRLQTRYRTLIPKFLKQYKS